MTWRVENKIGKGVGAQAVRILGGTAGSSDFMVLAVKDCQRV